jgi:hypothetical protein
MNDEPSNEAFGYIKVGPEHHEALPDKTSIYRHLGKHAMYDHVFVEIVHENQPKGVYVWNYMESYEEFAARAVHAGATLHLNLRKAAEQDVKEYEKSTENLEVSKAMEEIEGFIIPDDWK